MGKKSRAKKAKSIKKTKDSDLKTLPPEPQTSAPDWKKHLALIIILGIVIFIAYSPSLKGSFALDDVKIAKAVDSDRFPALFGYRSISYISFYLNKLTGKYFELSVRLTNLLIHLINSILIYVLVLVTLKIDKNKDLNDISQSRTPAPAQVNSFAAAAVSAFIFALHPLNINAVAYITQRMASLATVFVLLSLILYINASTGKKMAQKLVLYTLCALSLIIGIFTKENAVMGVPLILFYDYVFISKLNTRLFLKKIIIPAVICIAVLITASLSLRFDEKISELAAIFLNPGQPLVHKSWMATDIHWTAAEHLLTEFRVISRYLLLIIAPLPKFLVFDWWGYPVSKNILSPFTTLVSFIFISGIILLSVFKKKKYPFLFFGILWYFIAISLESFIAVGSDLYFEHRNYLPMTGLAMGLVLQAFKSKKAVSLQNSKTALITVLILICTLGSFTFYRNFIWKDLRALWLETSEKAPTNTRAFVTVGKDYFVTADFDMAEKYLKKSLDYALSMKQSYFYQESALYLGKIYLIKGDVRKAEEVTRVFNKRVPDSYRLKILKGLYLSDMGSLDKASAFYAQALAQARQENNKVHFFLNLGFADLYRKTGEFERSVKAYNSSIKNHPVNPLAHYGIAMIYMAREEMVKAGEHLEKALGFHPGNTLALSAKADMILKTEKDAAKALSYAEKALSSDPPFYEPYLAMGSILTYQGKDKEAEKYFKRSKTVWSPAPEYKINYSKAYAYFLKGDRSSSDIYLKKVLNDSNTPEKIKQSVRKKFF